jgi:hypothetical protein
VAEWGRTTEWYFLGHEAMYLLWPSDLEMRFLLPIAPLAGLYGWRGGRRLLGWAARRPRRTGARTALLAFPAAAHAGLWAARTGSVQLTLAAVFWTLLALAALTTASMPGARLRAGVERPPWPMLVSGIGAAALLLFTAEVGVGLAREARPGRDNLAFDLTARPTYPDVEAGRWLRARAAVIRAPLQRRAASGARPRSRVHSANQASTSLCSGMPWARRCTISSASDRPG